MILRLVKYAFQQSIECVLNIRYKPCHCIDHRQTYLVIVLIIGKLTLSLYWSLANLPCHCIDHRQTAFQTWSWPTGAYMFPEQRQRYLCCHKKKLTCKGTLRHLSVWDPEPYNSHSPLHTVSCIQYGYSHREGGGEVEPERRGEGQQGRVQITKLGWKCQHVWMYARNWLSPVY